MQLWSAEDTFFTNIKNLNYSKLLTLSVNIKKYLISKKYSLVNVFNVNTLICKC